MRKLLLLLFLSCPALALPPAEVVRKVYKVEIASQSTEKTIALAPECFTPGFLSVLQRAFQKQPPGPHVDWDILAFGQMGLGDYEVGEAQVKGKEAIVPVTLWNGRNGRLHSKAERKKTDPWTVRVLLTDVGSGFQIRDLVRTDLGKPTRVRVGLQAILEGHEQ